ncbi:MAG: hypothetical protein ACRDTX_19680 [Pseudonocardiaceae bacterium]
MLGFVGPVTVAVVSVWSTVSTVVPGWAAIQLSVVVRAIAAEVSALVAEIVVAVGAQSVLGSTRVASRSAAVSEAPLLPTVGHLRDRFRAPRRRKYRGTRSQPSHSLLAPVAQPNDSKMDHSPPKGVAACCEEVWPSG